MGFLGNNLTVLQFFRHKTQIRFQYLQGYFEDLFAVGHKTCPYCSHIGQGIVQDAVMQPWVAAGTSSGIQGFVKTLHPSAPHLKALVAGRSTFQLL